MVDEVIVRNCNESRCFDSADEIGGAMSKIQVIQPDICGSKDAYCAAIQT